MPKQTPVQKATADIRDDPNWTEVTEPNGPLEFRYNKTGDIYRLTNDGNLISHIGRPVPGHDTPEPKTHSRGMSWTGYQLTVHELRGFLNPLPDDAQLAIRHSDDIGSITATWEIP
jgi:hypothetical protein